MNPPSVRIGLLGAGGRLRGVVRNLLAADRDHQIQILGAFDPAPGALQSLREELGIDFEEMPTEEALISHPEIDWVFIGSWNCFHAGQVIAALRAGKHVFCEKPLATTLEDCLAIREAARESDRTFALGLVLRYSPHYQAIRRVIESGRLGRILSFEFNETIPFNHGGYIFGNWRRKRTNAGTHLLEKCCHDIDLANWLLESVPIRAASFGGCDFYTPQNAGRMTEIGPGPKGEEPYCAWPDPARVNPFSPGAEIFDNQVAILQYANGVRATFHANCHAAIPERRMLFLGTHGALRADVIAGKIEFAEVGWNQKIEVIDAGVAGGHGGGDTVMAEALVRTLCEGKPPLASVHEGLCSAIAVFGIDQAADESRVVDLLPLWHSAGIDPARAMVPNGR